jgi:hypothetical protein
MLTWLFVMTPRPMIWLTLSRETELTSLASTYSTKLARHFQNFTHILSYFVNIGLIVSKNFHRPNQHRRIGCHLQNSPLCTHLCPSQMEFRRPSREDVAIPQTYANVHQFETVRKSYLMISYFLSVTQNQKDNCPTTMLQSFCNLIGALWRNSVTNCIALFSRNSNSNIIFDAFLRAVNINYEFPVLWYGDLPWSISHRKLERITFLTTRMSCKLSKRFNLTLLSDRQSSCHPGTYRRNE